MHLERGSLDADGKGTYDMSWVSQVKQAMSTVDGVLTNS